MPLSIKQRFERLDSRRLALLTRAREFSELSIPSLLPRYGMNETSELPVPFSSATSRGVTRLASRIEFALVPLNNLPFFSLEIEGQEPIEGSDPTPEQAILTRLERRMMSKLSLTNFRSAVFAALQHLQVLGDCVLYANDNYNYSLYKLDQYVICRRPDGEWHEIIIKQQVDPASLPQVLIDAGFANAAENADRYNYAYDPANCFYTRVVSNHKGGCDVQREYKGRVFDKGTHPVCPYFPLRWILVSGENYGRGLVEDNCGDIRAVEVMAEALLDSIAANAEYRFGVNPAGLTEIHDLQESTNGGFVPAAQQDVFPIALQNQAAVAAAQASVTLKEQTLGQVFLLNSSIQRQGERVTATEVRILANELEQALGGVFSDSARELLIPVLRYLMYRMLQDGLLIPKEDPAAQKMLEEVTDPSGVLGLKVKTGLESLNREVENETMSQIIAEAKTFPPEGQEALIWSGLVNRWIGGKGIEPTGLVNTVQQVQQNRAMQQQAQMQQAAHEQALQTGGKVIEQNAAPQPQSQGVSNG